MVKIKKISYGFSLIELILVLVVASTIIISAFLLYSKTSEREKINSSVQQLSTILSVLNNETVTNNISWFTTDNVIKMKVLPEKTINSNRIINPWNGDVSVDNEFNSFFIQYTNVPVDACVNLIMQIFNSSYNISQIRGKTWDLNLKSIGNQYRLPTAESFCNGSNLDTNSKTVTLTFSDFGINAN